MTVASQARPSLEVMKIGDALETILLVLAADKAALQHALVLDRDRTGQDAPAKPAARDADRGQGGRGRRGAAGGHLGSSTRSRLWHPIAKSMSDNGDDDDDDGNDAAVDREHGAEDGGNGEEDDEKGEDDGDGI